MKYLLPLVVLLMPFAHVRTQSLLIEEIGAGQGLPQGFVTCLAQDREGFIWMGTSNCGLVRYDGHRFQQYTLDPFDSHSLSGNYVYEVSDLGEYLFVSTFWDGVNLFHKKTGRFFRLPFDAMQGGDDNWASSQRSITLNRFPASSAAVVGKTADGAIWIRAHRHPRGVFWLCRMTVPEGFWEQLPNSSPNEEAKLVSQLKLECWMLKNAFSGVLKDRKTVLREEAGKLLAWEGQGWQPLPAPISVGQQIDHQITCPSVPDAEFWLLRNGEIWKTRNQGTVWEKMTTAPAGLYFFHFGHDWAVGRKGNYFQAFPLQYSPFRIDFSKPLWSAEVLDERHNYLLDATDNLWYLNQVSGVRKFNPYKARFNTIRTEHARFEHPFLQTREGVLSYFIKDLLIHIKGEPKDLATFIESAFDREQMRLGIVKSDGKNLVCIGGRKLLAVVDIASRTSKNYLLPYLSAHAPNQFLVGQNGHLQMPIGEALINLDTKADTAISLDFRHAGMSGLRVYAIEKTNDGAVWLATDDGLLRIFPTPGERLRQDTIQAAGKQISVPVFKANIRLYKTDPKDRASMRSNFTSSLLVDPSDPNILWIGTKGGGLQRLDLRLDKFAHITAQNGLNDDVVYGVLPDAAGNLWLGTNKGLTCYNPDKGTFKHFTKADGLQDDEFNTSSSAKTPDGTLYFGGISGMNVFDPATISDNPKAPVVRITGLEVNNRKVAVGDSTGILRTAIWFTEKITLPYSKNSITLEFAALEFTAPSKNKYRYWLEGLENEREARTSHKPHATYLGLPPGSYTFVVYGSNNDGVWSDQPARLKIRILPPWYRTWWAYLLYALLFGGLINWYWVMREKRRELQHDLEKKEFNLQLHRSELAHAEAMHKLKLEEFAHHLLEKSRLIEELNIQLTNEKNDNGKNDEALGDKTKKQLLNVTLLTKEDWSNFQKLFEDVYPTFQQDLMKQIPALTPAENRLLLLSKLGLTRQEIATMLGVSTDAVKKTRQRLQRKLLEQHISFADLLGENSDLNN